MDEITARREATQPIREKTGGSTFKNPPGDSAWKLVDAAGWRGKPFGGAMFSPLHANFLINTGEATAADLEGLGEAVRADVAAKIGVELEWEIKRIGRRTRMNAAAGRAAVAAVGCWRCGARRAACHAQEPPPALSARRALPRLRQRRGARDARSGLDRRGLGERHRQPADRRPHRPRRRRQADPGRRHLLGDQPRRPHLDLPPARRPVVGRHRR